MTSGVGGKVSCNLLLVCVRLMSEFVINSLTIDHRKNFRKFIYFFRKFPVLVTFAQLLVGSRRIFELVTVAEG
jgi:hypothetical protein